MRKGKQKTLNRALQTFASYCSSIEEENGFRSVQQENIPKAFDQAPDSLIFNLSRNIENAPAVEREVGLIISRDSRNGVQCKPSRKVAVTVPS